MPNLLDIQHQLQLEADIVVRLLKLDELLANVGQPIRVGSSAMGSWFVGISTSPSFAPTYMTMP